MLAEQPMCATGCGRLARIDDHVVPIGDGGAVHDPANHQGLCGPCHDEKTAAENATRRRPARSRG